MTERTETVNGCVISKKKTANRTTWDHDGLFNAIKPVAAKARVSPEGEVLEGEMDAYIRTLKDVASVSYWRMGALNEAGVNASDYREVEYGREKIVVERVVGDGEQPDDGEREARASHPSKQGGS
jgi:hypothetical protein